MVRLVRVPRVGVLALQGDFARHQASLEALGVVSARVTSPAHLADLDALVLPGGESTTMTRLLRSTGLREPLERFARERPVLGTCAGAILLAHGAEGLPEPTLGLLDVEIDRNAYGRQIDSFHDEVDAPVVGGGYHAVFIRAPRIRRVGPGVEVVVRRRDPSREPVGVRQGRLAALTFHPELTNDLRLHRWFLAEVAGLALPDGVGAAQEEEAR